ncbi:MAG: kinase, partial [Solirubrobacteraceae bacterium]|nr:kinase [Solirubrobacteraceae bacterium]
AVRSVTVLTHSRPQQIAHTLERLIADARECGVLLRFDCDETLKLGLRPQPGIVCDAEPSLDVELCIVLGGDGTILQGLRQYARTSVPVFAVNFGEIGFLATLDPKDLDGYGFTQALQLDFEQVQLPAITIQTTGGPLTAINDISFHRQVGGRVAQLAYGVEGEEAGSVRCDGLAVCTAAGSTGYNLANGGPVMAWGVEGFTVSFIAPHSLTARALVVAPGDALSVSNRGREAVDLNVDGRPACQIAPGETLVARYEPNAARLAQLPGWSFYRRLRTKFGRLSS